MWTHDFRSLRSLGMVLALIASGCDDDEGVFEADAALVDAGAGDAGDFTTLEEDVGVVSAIISGEIDRARLALERASDPGVLSYAQRVIARRESFRTDLDAWLFERTLAPREGPASTRVQREDDAVRRQLEPLQGTAFERTYLAAEVASHERTLELIDETLLPGAPEPSLRELWARLRSDLVDELALARQLGG